MRRRYDPVVGEALFKLKTLSHKLYAMDRDGREADLMVALYDILCEATRARMRLNDLGVWDPLREPMGS